MRFLPDPTILTVIAQTTSDPRLRSGRRVLPGLLFGLLVLAVYANPLFFRRNFTGRDLPAYELPMEKAVHDAWRRGRVPVWVDEISGGRPLLPNPNSGAFYPPRMAMALLPFSVASRVFPVLHWIAAGLGMMALLRASRVSVAGAFVGACTYAFSGVAVSLVFYPYLPGMALLPWIVLAAGRAASGRAGPILALSVLLGVDLLAGEVFTIALALVSVTIWFLAETPREQRRRAFLALGAALGLALLLAAPQICATALWIPQTRRGVSGITVEDAILFSLSPFRLLELVIPYPFGTTWFPGAGAVWGQRVFHGKTMGLFATLYAGALGVFALPLRPAAAVEGTRAARWLFGIATAAAVVPALVPASLYGARAPVALRYPEKFSIASLLALAFLAGAAVDRFAAQGRPSSGVVLGSAAALALLAGAAHYAPHRAARLAVSLTGSPPGSESIAAARLPAALAEAALLAAGTAAAILLLGSHAPARAAAVVILAAIPILADRRIALTAGEEEVLGPTPFARFLQREDPAGRFRTLGESLYLPPSALELRAIGSDVALTDLARRHWSEYQGALWARGTVLNIDCDSGDLSRVHSLREIARVAAGYRDSAAFFGSLSLRWGIRFRDQPPLAGYRRIGGDALQDWDAQPDADPDIRLAARWREVAGPVDALRALPRLSAGELVVETGTAGQGRARPGRLVLLEKSPERLRLDVDSPDSTFLHVLRAFWTYRTIRIDGRAIEAVPSQLAFSAIAIPPGRHRIDWREDVPGASVSRWGPVLYMLAALLVAARFRRPAR